MANPYLGFLFTGLVIRTVLAAAIIVAVLWFVFKLGKLVDAYTEKLRAK